MPISKIFVDNGRKIKVDQDFGSARFNVRFPNDIYSVLHYIKWHPEVIKDNFQLNHIKEEIQIDDELVDVTPTDIKPENGQLVEVYCPKENIENNYVLLNQDIPRPMYDILREFAVFLGFKKEEFGKVVPRETKIKQVDPYEFDWKDAMDRCYNVKDAISSTSCGSLNGNPKSMCLYIGENSKASHDFYLDYLDNLPEADLERLVKI